MLQHIFVVDNSGIPVYARCIGHKCALGNLDSLAVSGLLTALNTFAKEIGVGTLQAINMEKAKFILKTEGRYFTTFQIESQDKSKEYQKDLLDFSEFLKTIYLAGTPVGKPERIRIATEVERFIAEHELTKEKISLWQRFLELVGLRKKRKSMPMDSSSMMKM